MRKALAIIGMGFLSYSFGLDEYLSIESGKVELDAGYWYVSPTDLYDKDGDKTSIPGSPMQSLFPLQVKYGVIPGLDVELGTTGVISNKDAGDLGGFTQPDIAVKYTHTPLNVGGYLDLVLPFAMGNLDVPEPAMGIQLGAVYANRFGDFRLTAQAGYQINMENEDKLKQGNMLLLYAKPEAMWTEFIGTYLGLKYQMWGESEVDGTAGKDTDASLFTVLPGLNTVLLPWLAYEVNAPITLMGKNQPASWGIGASIYVTLPM
jgi:hypothetical protein